MKVHVHKWELNGHWTCTAPDHIHFEPDILDATSIWHTLGVIKTHLIIKETLPDIQCMCGWTGDTEEYGEHLDDAIFFWLRDIDEKI